MIYIGKQIPTSIGIPQDSSLSPILLLFFVSTLLPTLQTSSTSGIGFVDDTKMLKWLSTTRENCKKLEALYKFCEARAAKNGVNFAQEKYGFMHFTPDRKRLL